MRVTDVLAQIKITSGSNAKKGLLEGHDFNTTFKKVLRYSLDPFITFNVVKVPKVKKRLEFPLSTDEAWSEFFRIADLCASRDVTGNSAIDMLYTCFSSVSPEDEVWMRKVLKKNLAIGVSTKTVNKVFPGLVTTFDVSLAQKFEEKRIVGKQICVEPKLDGIRCIAIVRNGEVSMYARSGKPIINFDKTVGEELTTLPNGVYDGELMGEDFTALMRQAYRKENVQTDATYFSIFDYLTLREWDTQQGFVTCNDRYIALLHYVMPERYRYLRVVERLNNPTQSIESIHDKYVDEGYEGVMVKNLDAPYTFGRSHDVMKYKAFHDVDLRIQNLLEGTGKHSGKLGSIVVVYKGVEVQVGSGLTDELRETIWNAPDDFLGRLVEIRYQEVTPDGSLRFPTFVCFRNDR